MLTRSKDIEYFTDVEKAKLQSRGSVLVDAIYMLKEYGSYEEIINLSDKEIKEFLIKYYDKKLLYAKYVKYAGQLYEKEAIDIDSVINSKQYENSDYEYGVGDYDSVIVPGYNDGKADLFLKTTNTDNGYIVNGDNVGVEGGFDPHLHFSVNTGYNITYGLYDGDGGLTSSNPFIYFET